MSSINQVPTGMEQYQVLVVIGGVLFASVPLGITEAEHTVNAVQIAAPNTDPMIVEVKK